MRARVASGENVTRKLLAHPERADFGGLRKRCAVLTLASRNLMIPFGHLLSPEEKGTHLYRLQGKVDIIVYTTSIDLT